MMVANIDSQFFIAIYYAVPSICPLLLISKHFSVNILFDMDILHNLKFMLSSFWCKQY